MGPGAGYKSGYVKVQIRKSPLVLKTVSYRPLKDMNLDAFGQDLLGSALLTEAHMNLSGLLQCYNDCLSKVLDSHAMHAPVITKDLPDRPCQPWYNNTIRSEIQI